ncbi:MAG: hypothetical protein LUD17_03970 [Bacteroidales bacterium]|nr:hypothetical protein [Bacteroidales bacterium]
MKTTTIFVLLGLLLLSGLAVYGQEEEAPSVVRKKLITETPAEYLEMVKVGKDTVPIAIPDRNWGRYDRGLFNYLYIPKGKWAFGFTASYGELNTEDVQLLSILKDVDFDGKIYSLKPTISYFFSSNQAVGMRLNYTRGVGDLANLAMDFDDDIDFSLHDVSYYSQSYTLGVFYRNYVGLNRDKRFAVFNEVSLEFGSGSSRFKRYYDGELFDTHTLFRTASLNFSPGICVFLQDYVAFNLSFGVFGIKMRQEDQKTNGVDEGSRFSSGANFKFNIFNIDFGLLIVI